MGKTKQNYSLLIVSDIFVQFLQDIFDALFAILNEGAEQYGNLVFQALVCTYIYFNNNIYELAMVQAPRWLDKTVGRTLRHRRGHELESLKSRTILNFCVFISGTFVCCLNSPH